MTHINWKTKVKMPSLEEVSYRDALRELVRDATDDDLLAAFLYHTEGEVIGEVYESAYEFLRQVESEVDRAKRLRPAEQPLPVRADYLHACERLQDQLEAELDHAIKREKEAIATLEKHYSEAGATDLSGRYRRDAPTPVSLEKAGRLECDLQVARRRLAAVLREHAETMHQIALREADYLAFIRTPGSVQLSSLNAMTYSEFEQAAAALARRDGLEVVRGRGGRGDLGADVIALASDGRRIVIQCKHRRSQKRPCGSEVIQTVNGTARPEHGADIAVVLTNGTFTQPARELADRHGIHLLWGDRLERWATWGTPILEVLDEDHHGLERAPDLAENSAN
ncbi:restriction endonuclease [Kitasatospora sp. NPDC090091]|uniref:restriction endonuclease n=1 Tax=Kitasatospora sp. NPDC090091 TaxID=3364081 RepID=UPI0037FBA0AD